MIKGLYTAGTGMMVQRNRMDVVTNNIVNAETAGFKKDTMVSQSFRDVLIERINDPNVVSVRRYGVGPYNFGTHIEQVFTNFRMGNLESTGHQDDLAIQGRGFFAVETPQGERYTRAGSFFVNPEGYLVNDDGYFVLADDGTRVNVGLSEFTVDQSGGITADGTLVAQLRIVDFADEEVLRKEGNNLFYPLEGAPVAGGEYRILQGYIENSNVDIGSEMVNMITLYRAYEANQRILSMTDESLGMATTQIGSVK